MNAVIFSHRSYLVGVLLSASAVLKLQNLKMQNLFKLLKQKYPNKQVVVKQDTTHWLVKIGTELFPVSKSELSLAENNKTDEALLIKLLSLN